MTDPIHVLEQARKWVGRTETPIGSNHVSGVTDWYGLDRQPWCAMWISRIFFDAGLPLPATIGKGFAYCPSGVNWFKKQGRWKEGNPSPGDVVFFQWPGQSVASHIGVVEAVDSDGAVRTIEGNTNAQGSSEGLHVMRQRRRTGILGFGSPPYSAPKTLKSSLVRIVSMIAHPSLDGYWEVGEDGGVFSYGDVSFFGSMGGRKMNAPVVGAAVHSSGNGYWLVGADGGIFNFGASKFHGSMGGKPLNQPITGIAAHHSGDGYWLSGRDGGVFAFGQSEYKGSANTIK